MLLKKSTSAPARVRQQIPRGHSFFMLSKKLSVGVLIPQLPLRLIKQPVPYPCRRTWMA